MYPINVLLWRVSTSLVDELNIGFVLQLLRSDHIYWGAGVAVNANVGLVVGTGVESGLTVGIMAEAGLTVGEWGTIKVCRRTLWHCKVKQKLRFVIIVSAL